jgi:hypothetical protein
MSDHRTDTVTKSTGSTGRRRIRAATFHLLPAKTVGWLGGIAAVLLMGTAAAFVLRQPIAGMTIALPALIAAFAAIRAYTQFRTTVNIDTDGIRFRQGGRVKSIVSWADYTGWGREENALLLQQYREEPVRIPNGGRKDAWNDLTAMLDNIAKENAAQKEKGGA